jgi:hypothetical protein
MHESLPCQPAFSGCCTQDMASKHAAADAQSVAHAIHAPADAPGASLSCDLDASPVRDRATRRLSRSLPTSPVRSVPPCQIVSTSTSGVRC